MKYLFVIIFTIGVAFSFAQGIEKSQRGTFLLKGGQVYTHDQGLVATDVLIKEGLIAKVGESITDTDATILDCSGLEIYPGMIDLGTKLGLAEIGAVSLTQDHNEIGDFTPHMQALTAINPNSVNIPVNRVNGVTTVLSVPTGGLFPGTAAAIDLHGYTPKQMHTGFSAPVLNFPSTGRRGRWDSRSEEEIKKQSDKNLKKLNGFWKQAKLYASIKAKGGTLDYNPQMEALTEIFNSDQPLLIEVNKKDDILAAIRWVSKDSINAVFTGMSEGYRVLDSLVKYSIPVITGPILQNPSRASDRYDVAYANAGKMAAAGLLVAIKTDETENVRNLPYNAAFAATYGMGREAAFKAVTLNAARVIGLEDKYGSIEEGKIANLFVADGDPFETKTDILHLFIRGWKVSIESRHTQLYDEFLERDPSLKN